MRPWVKTMRKWQFRVLDTCFWVNLALVVLNIYAGRFDLALYSAFMGLFCWAASELVRPLEEKDNVR